MEGYRNLLSAQRRSSLMGFAILSIILFHFAMYGNLLRFQAIDFLFGKGYLGVDVFFFLSAYGLCYSLNKYSTKEFYIRRLKKLFPVYLLFLAFLFLAFPASRGSSWILTSIYQITGLSMFVKLDIEWFIPALILLYAVFPLLYKGLFALYRKGFGAICCLIIIIALVCIPLSRFVHYLFAFRLLIIILGILTYFALHDNDKAFLLGIYALCAFLGILFIGQDRLNVSLTGSLFIPLLLYAIGQVSIPFERFKILPFVGSHTLEIYLAQCLAFNHFMASNFMRFVPASLVSLAITIVTSAVFYCFQSVFKHIAEHAK